MLSSGNKLSVQFSLFLQLLFVMNNSCKFLKKVLTVEIKAMNLKDL